MSPSPSPAANLVELAVGGGTQRPANGLLATDVQLNRPIGVAFEGDGSYWVVDASLGLFFHVLTDSTISDVTGGLLGPAGITVTPDGKVYIAERANYRIDLYDGHGGFQVVGGNEHFTGASGDGGALNKALFFQPDDIASDGAGNLYINDLGNQRIRWVDAATNIVDTIAGNGTAGFSGDGGPATDAQVSNPWALAVDEAGTELLIADGPNGRLRRVDLAGGEITTIAGNGGQSGRYDASLTGPSTAMTHLSAIALDAAGNVYLPVFWGDLGLVLERMAPTGELTLIAGGGSITNGGVSSADFHVLDALCLAVNPVNGDLHVCSPDGRIYAVPSVPPA